MSPVTDSSTDWSAVVRERYLEALRGAFGGMLDRLDDALFELAERSEEEDQRADYFEVMRGIRTTRAELMGQFLAVLEDVWGGSSPPAPVALEQGENMALSLAVRYAEGECADELALLRRRLMPLVEHPRGVQQALSPRVLFGTFEAVCAGLQAGMPVRMLLLKFFERHVGAELKSIYRSLLDLLEGQSTALSVSPAAAQQDDEPPGVAGGDIGQIVGQLVQGGQGAGPAAVEVLKLLATHQSDGGGAYSRTASLDLRRYGGQQTAAAGVDLTVDMMALLYDGSYSDATISTFVKVQLARLQLPLLKLALRDPDFLSRRSHPARRFFSALLTLGRTRGHSLEASEEARLGEMVDLVAERCVEEAAVFETALAHLAALMPVAPAWPDPDRIERAEHEVLHAIEQRRAGKNLPDPVDAFLSGHWLRYLVDVHLRHGHRSTAWRRALATTESLIWAATAPDTPEDRARLAQLRPRLMRSLREGLDALGVPSVQQEAFYAQVREMIDAALYVEPPAQEIDLAGLDTGEEGRHTVTITNPAGEAVEVPEDEDDGEGEPDDAAAQRDEAAFFASETAGAPDEFPDFEEDAEVDVPEPDVEGEPEPQESEALPEQATATATEPEGEAAPAGLEPKAVSPRDALAELLRQRGVDADSMVIEEIVLEGGREPGSGGAPGDVIKYRSKT